SRTSKGSPPCRVPAPPSFAWRRRARASGNRPRKGKFAGFSGIFPEPCLSSARADQGVSNVQRASCLSRLRQSARSGAPLAVGNPALSGRLGAVLSPDRALAVQGRALLPRPAGQPFLAQRN